MLSNGDGIFKNTYPDNIALSSNSYIQLAWLLWLQMTRSLAASGLLGKPFSSEMIFASLVSLFSSFIQENIFGFDLDTMKVLVMGIRLHDTF